MYLMQYANHIILSILTIIGLDKNLNIAMYKYINFLDKNSLLDYNFEYLNC